VEKLQDEQLEKWWQLGLIAISEEIISLGDQI
jgi:hypothetical protein